MTSALPITLLARARAAVSSSPATTWAAAATAASLIARASRHRPLPSTASSVASAAPLLATTPTPAAVVTRTANDGDTIAGDASVRRSPSRSTPAAATARAMTSSSDHDSTPTQTQTQTPTELVDGLLERTSRMVRPHGANLVAFSGGVDSSLAAALVHWVFHGGAAKTNTGGYVRAVLGVSPALSSEELQLARQVAEHVGLDLTEISTSEGDDPIYVKNEGMACMACKTHLYSALRAVASHAHSHAHPGGDVLNNRTGSPAADHHLSPPVGPLSSGALSSRDFSSATTDVVLFNGTNADDLLDPTRVGLRAAERYSVESPLSFITKNDVRRAARHLGLPNWNRAASPCLRSRLAFGVEATAEHLRRVERAERRVREVLGLEGEWRNVRVRVLAGDRAAVELDADVLDGDSAARALLEGGEFGGFLTGELGFAGGYVVRPFRSGSVAAVARG